MTNNEVGGGGGSDSSLVCLLRALVKDTRVPLLQGNLRQRIPKWRRPSQESWSLVNTTFHDPPNNHTPVP